MKLLDVGCGKKKHKGYIGIDIEPSNKPDILGDFRQMDFEEVDRIRARHLLEHFSREESLKILKLWHDWLKMDGTLIIETPDFETTCVHFIKSNNSAERYWLIRHLYGSQEADWSFHKDGWYESKFRWILPKLGFEVTSVLNSISRGYLPNIIVIARKIK